MLREVQERIHILKNSIKILEKILSNIGRSNNLIQNRIEIYKQEIHNYKGILN